MNTSSKPTILTQLLLCASLMVASAVAGAGVNRCVDGEGSVLLTDAECPQGSRVANDEVSDDAASGIIINSGVNSGVNTGFGAGAERVAPVARAVGGLPRSRWADLPRPLVRKSAGPDALTLQAARSTLMMQDEMRRQSRMASR
jgi:hypothetical protein